MSEVKSVWQKARRFPETKAQKTVTGSVLMAKSSSRSNAGFMPLFAAAGSAGWLGSRG